MREGLSPVLVAGGAGFIGGEFVRLCVSRGYRVVVADKLTYAGDLSRIADVESAIKFYRTDISRPEAVKNIFKVESPAAVVNFAAETHVDRSIENPGPFINSNVKGTQVLLEWARRFGAKRFVQVSTDEVYGEIETGSFSEKSPLKPGSPYAASKAAADLLISSYVRTFAFPALIVRPSNNYGPRQFPEKLIPLAIMKALGKEKIPVYGNGLQRREWLYVSDCAAGVLSVLERGGDGEIYNLGSGFENKNIDTVGLILKAVGRPPDMVEFVRDRPGHDFRYSVDSEKVRRETGWRPETGFAEGLEKTVRWFKENRGAR